MAFKEACPVALVLVLFTWVTGWAEADVESFENESVDCCGPPSSYEGDYCNGIMKARGLNHKMFNSFVHAPMKDIEHICTNEGGTSHPMYFFMLSRKPFSYTICSAAEWFPNADGVYSHYNNEQYNNRIQIECENGVPIRYYGVGQPVYVNFHS